MRPMRGLVLRTIVVASTLGAACAPPPPLAPSAPGERVAIELDVLGADEDVAAVAPAVTARLQRHPEVVLVPPPKDAPPLTFPATPSFVARCEDARARGVAYIVELQPVVVAPPRSWCKEHRDDFAHPKNPSPCVAWGNGPPTEADASIGTTVLAVRECAVWPFHRVGRIASFVVLGAPEQSLPKARSALARESADWVEHLVSPTP